MDGTITIDERHLLTIFLMHYIAKTQKYKIYNIHIRGDVLLGMRLFEVFETSLSNAVSAYYYRVTYAF